jgi:hypothetical protein
MNYSSHAHLAVARAWQDDMLRRAEHERLARSFRDSRPGILARLRSRFAREQQPQPRPVTT